MMGALLALLVVVSNGLISVPASRWQALPLNIGEDGTTVECSFEVREGSRVNVMILDRPQAERFHRGRAFQPLYSTGFQKADRFRFRVQQGGKYVLMIDNRIEGRGPAAVKLRVDLMGTTDVSVWELPPERRRLVVALSLGFFGAVIALSARQFLKRS